MSAQVTASGSGKAAAESNRSIESGEISTKFYSILESEELVKVKFTGMLAAIVGAKNKYRFLKGIAKMIRNYGAKVGALADAQVQIIEQITDAELATWGVSRDKMKEEFLFGELEKLGQVYQSSVVKRQNNNLTTEKYWGLNWIKDIGALYPPWPSVEFMRMCAKVASHLSFDRGMDLVLDVLPRLVREIKARLDTPRTMKETWIMVEDLKWVLQQEDLPEELPLEDKQYHQDYQAMMISLGKREGEEKVVELLANAEARERAGRAPGDDDAADPMKHPLEPRRSARIQQQPQKSVAGQAGKAGRITGKRTRKAISPEIEVPAYRRYRLERTHDLDCDRDIIDLLDNATPEKLGKLDEAIVQDLNIVERIRNLLHTTHEGANVEEEVEDVPDDRIIRRIMMLLNGERVKICPTQEELPPRHAAKKRRGLPKSVSPEEEEEEELVDDDEEEEEEVEDDEEVDEEEEGI